MKKKKNTGKKNIIINAVFVVVLVMFVSVTAATIRFLASGGEKKPFFLPEKTAILTGVDKSVLEHRYGDKYRDYLGRFKNLKNKREIPRIHIDEAAALFVSGKAVFIDARAEHEYQKEHIAGALSIPSGKAHEAIPALKSKLKNKYLVVYCHGIGCRLSDKTAYKLFDAGYKKTGIFFGGWNEWKERDYPVEKPTDFK